MILKSDKKLESYNFIVELNYPIHSLHFTINSVEDIYLNVSMQKFIRYCKNYNMIGDRMKKILSGIYMNNITFNITINKTIFRYIKISRTDKYIQCYELDNKF